MTLVARRRFLQLAGAAVALGCNVRRSGTAAAQNNPVLRETAIPPLGSRLVLSDEAWRARLTAEQYDVLRHEGTERAFTGAYWNEHAAGTYVCAGCGAPLFSSAHKFESGTGWPSFYQPIEPGRVTTRSDSQLGFERTEVHCARCGGHQGHVFDDRPPPTGLRYCINSAALLFRRA